jgi:TolB-like protein/DNA-binding winged helix-turn-helix (wHTH) protein/tetratricopeptide (TPR) repeat protein
MHAVQPGQRLVRFSVFELDARARELRKHGVRIKLQEQPLQILQILLEHPGEVVTRDELQERIWPADTFVDFDHGLYNAVKKLREALGDTVDTPRFIETLPKRGYRFIGTVSGNGARVPAVDSEPPTAVVEPNRNYRRPVVVITIAAVLVLGVAFAVNRDKLQGSNAPFIRSVAVLPLQNLSGDPAQDYFADGMTEELITELSGISSIQVISRTSTMRYKKSDKSIPEIARELNVDAIVEGSVLHSGDRVRITAQLIYAPKDTNLWAETYDRDLKDVLGLQSEIAGAIASQVRIKTTPQERVRLNRPPSVNAKALEAYLQGEYHANRYGKGFGQQESETAISYFQQAIAEDPSFARPYVEMACAYEGLMLPSNQRWPMERAATEKALTLDPNLAEAHFAMGRVKFFYERNFAAAEREFKRAIELNPSSADAHDWFALYLSSQGRLAESEAETELAERLDPSDYLNCTCTSGGEVERGISLLKNEIALNPEEGSAHLELAKCYATKGMQKEYIDELQRTASLFGFPKFAKQIARAYATAGYQAALRAWAEGLDENGVNRPLMVAETYVRLGDKDLALQWLERGYSEHDDDMVFLNSEAVWHPLRSDPRFKDLLRRVGLSQ